MKFSPFKVRPLALWLAFASCAHIAGITATAQSGQRTARTPARRTAKESSAAKASKAKERTRLERQQLERAQAVALLRETADAARSFDDLYHRAVVQALAADALWSFDEEGARFIFRRAWEAATAHDNSAAGSDRTDDSRDRDETEVRPTVLSTIARRDPRLTETLMREWNADLATQAAPRDAEASGASAEDAATPNAANETASQDDIEKSGQHSLWRGLSRAGAQRLRVAWTLLSQEQYRSAADVATPLVNEGVTHDLMTFILLLHAKSPADAAPLYLRLLEYASRAPAADVNDALLLSSPVVSPQVLVMVDANGSVQFRQVFYLDISEEEQAREVAPTLRAAFYQTAASILLRPTREGVRAGGVTPATEGGDRLARFFAIGRLLPFFERDAPQYAAQLHARQSALTAETGAAQRTSLTSNMSRQRVSPHNPRDPLQPLIESVSSKADPQERDRARLQLVETAARRRYWERARSAAREIEDATLRRAAQSVIAAFQVSTLSRSFEDDEDPRDFERAALFVHNADVPPAIRASGLAQAALLAARKKNRARALELLEEAGGYAAQVEPGTETRVAAYAHLTGTASRVAPARAWEWLTALVAAINSVEDFEAEDSPAFALEADGDTVIYIDLEGWRTDTLFAVMARLDFARALAEARTLRDEPTRAYASVAIARAALEKREGGAGPGN